MELPINPPFDLIKFELYKIEYLIKHTFARTIFSFWPSIYNYNNIKSHFIYLIGLLSLLTFSYLFSMTRIGLILMSSLSVLIFIYIVFLINLFFMVVHIGLLSKCDNDVCNNRSKGRFCINCEIFLRKNPFILLGVPKVVINKSNLDIRIETKLFIQLIISETNFIKYFKRIIINFDNNDGRKIIDPFTINIILSQNKKLADIIRTIFYMDLYFSKIYIRLNSYLNVYEIPRKSEEKVSSFIKKYNDIIKILDVLNIINSKHKFTVNISDIKLKDNIQDKIKNVGLLKMKKFLEIDEELAKNLIRNLQIEDFLNLL
ncbi:MAG: hypothetical protein ACTSPY_00960 [Candidatus Helarchaeota archaeon]